MRLLLDTHIALWAIADDPKLAKEARVLIEDSANSIFVSAVTVWEIAIKHALRLGRRDRIALSGREAVRHFESAGYALLQISEAHGATIDDLPPHHSDPFDRMLVAQALHEPLRLLTHDAQLAAYGEMVTVV